MTPTAHFTDLSTAAAALPARPLHLAIGMFDGVHVGHRAVIAAAVQAARAAGGTAAVLTFWPHPSALFRPQNPTRLLMDDAARTGALLELGVDAVITLPFTPEFARIVAEDFLPWVRARLPQLATVYVGENFRFGQGRRGDVALLVAGARSLGLGLFSAPRVNFNGEPISSTRLRASLAAGRMEEATAMLGRPYAAESLIIPGRQLGRTIGFPTLNLAWAPGAGPALGVYVARVAGTRAAAPLPAVANYGLRPTVGTADAPLLEVHVLGDCPFGTGDTVVVEWLHFLRPEQKFASVDALRAQIVRDRAAAVEHFRLS